MDEIVKAALARWPNVPHAYGWLKLDARGAWFIKGSRVDNAAIADFIGRNYAHDEEGRWFFQNGPQRVYVALDTAPWVLAFAGNGDELLTHTGERVNAISAAWQDAAGTLYVTTDLGPAAFDDRALARAADMMGEANSAPVFCWRGEPFVIRPIAQTPVQLGFVADPQPAHGEPEC
jgi:hypothetical protein